MRAIALACVTTLIAAGAVAQVPATDVYIVEMPDEPFADAVSAVNITDRHGYDNQPRFSTDGRFIYFTSIGDDDQADVYRYDIESETRSRVTFSAESEYSPTPGSGFVDVVRVEIDGTQRLWRYHEEERRFETILPELQPVGYFGWIDSSRVVAFVLGEPHLLVSADPQTGEVDTLASDVGRTIAAVPGRNAVSYIQKSGGGWSIDMIDFESGSSGTITPTLPGREDFAWTPDGRILMADVATIYVWTSAGGTWERFIDLSDQLDGAEITRLAVSPRGSLLAFVASRIR